MHSDALIDGVLIATVIFFSPEGETSLPVVSTGKEMAPSGLKTLSVIGQLFVVDIGN